MSEVAKPLNVFLSYTQADVIFARELYRYLIGKGLTVWFDEENLAPGQNWQREISKGLNDADAIILCFSQSAAGKSGTVQKEFQFTLDQVLTIPEEQKCIIPVRFQVCAKPKQLSRFKWVDLFEQGGHENLMRGLKYCAKGLGRAEVAHESQPQKPAGLKDVEDFSANIGGRASKNVIIYGNNNVIHHTLDDVEKIEKDDREAREKQLRERAEAAQLPYKEAKETPVPEKAHVEKPTVEPLPKVEKDQPDQAKKGAVLWAGLLMGCLIFAVIAFLVLRPFMQVAAPETSPTPKATATHQPSATLTQQAISPSPTSTPAPAASATATIEAEPSATASQTLTSVPNDVLISPKDKMPLLPVPAGPFIMGDDKAGSSEKPAHKVTLNKFYIDKTEITNAMYALCVADGACKILSNFASSKRRPDYYNNPQYANYPVTHVFWRDANAYCEWAGRTLPSEAQWEKAARGGDLRYTYPWGNNPPTENLLNYYNPSLGETSEVGQYPEGASPYGALDMAGNVWEWVKDYYDPKYYSDSPDTNPTGPKYGDAFGFRGGSWSTDKATVRTFYRGHGSSGYLNFDLGFRCAFVP